MNAIQWANYVTHLVRRLLGARHYVDIRATVPRDVLAAAGEGCRFIDSVRISRRVQLGRFVSINGPATRISALVNDINIGSFSSIASSVVIQEANHDMARASTYGMARRFFSEPKNVDYTSKGPIHIEDDVWIGSGAVVLSGVRIGRGSVIGAGSVVTRDIPKYSICAGNPCRVIKKRFPSAVIEELEASGWWDWSTKDIRHNRAFFMRHRNG